MTAHVKRLSALIRGEDLAVDLEKLAADFPGLAVDMFRVNGEIAEDALASASVADIVFLDADLQAAAASDLARLRGRKRPNASMIVAARNHTVDGMRQLFRQGATDVLPTPLQPADLRAAVADALGQSGGDDAPAGEVISVMSAVGGAGATTVAANLAGALALGRSRKKEGANSGTAALLDFDLQFGDAALALDMQPRTSLLDVLKSPERLDAAFFDGVAARHATGLKLLAAPPEIVPLDAMDAATATALIGTAAGAHEAVVVDLPRAWTDWTAPVLNASDLVILVSDPSVAGVAGARRVFDAFASLDVKSPEVMLVINHVAGPIEALDRIGRVRDALGRPVDAQLREDSSAARGASDAGRLPIDAEARSKLGKDLIALTDAVRERAAMHVKARRAARG